MAIFHVHMVGSVKGEIEIIKDEDGQNICCAFEMLVKEKNERIPFTIYVNDKELIQKCENELITGSAILVNGILEVDFHNMKVSTQSRNAIPIITSTMTIISDDICILYGKQKYEHITNIEKINPIGATKCNSDNSWTYDLDTELPF